MGAPTLEDDAGAGISELCAAHLRFSVSDGPGVRASLGAHGRGTVTLHVNGRGQGGVRNPSPGSLDSELT